MLFWGVILSEPGEQNGKEKWQQQQKIMQRICIQSWIECSRIGFIALAVWVGSCNKYQMPMQFLSRNLYHQYSIGLVLQCASSCKSYLQVSFIFQVWVVPRRSENYKLLWLEEIQFNFRCLKNRKLNRKYIRFQFENHFKSALMKFSVMANSCLLKIPRNGSHEITQLITEKS